MSNVPGGPGWLLGEDGKWYPPNAYNQPGATQSPPFNAQPQYQSPVASPNPPTYGYQPGYQAPMQGGFQPATQYGQPAVPKSSKKGAIIAVIVVLVLLISGGTTGYMVLSASTDNPTPAVNSFLAAVLAKDAPTACTYVTGMSSNNCISSLNSVFKQGNVSGSLKAANYQVSGNEALVSVTGQACGVISSSGNGNKCSNNGNPNYGLPTGGTTFGRAWTNVTSSSSPIFIVPCEKINGTWYVYLQGSSPNSGNSGNSGPPTGNRQVESDLGNAIIEMNVIYTENGGNFYDCPAGTTCTTPSMDMAAQMAEGETNITYTDNAPMSSNTVQVAFSSANLTGNTSNVAEAMAFSPVKDVCYAVFINKSGVQAKTSDGTVEGTGTYYGISLNTVTKGCTMGPITDGGYAIGGTTIKMVWSSDGFLPAP